MMKSTFVQTMDERGFVKQATNITGLDNLMAHGPMAAYIGFDCTAASLHIGSLLPIPRDETNPARC